MKFNLWFVLLLALMPVFILLTGLTAAGGFESAAAWEIIGIVVLLIAVWYFALGPGAGSNSTTNENNNTINPPAASMPALPNESAAP